MKSKLILLCAPSGTGKTTVARILAATDNRFCHVQVLTTRPLRSDEDNRPEKKYIELEDLKAMEENGELVSFNEKDGVHYGISRKEIASPLAKNINPVLEWDINNLNYWDALFPVFKVILKPSSNEKALSNLQDGRDPQGIRTAGVLREMELIKAGNLKADVVIENFDAAIMDTVMRIRSAIFQSLP